MSAQRSGGPDESQRYVGVGPQQVMDDGGHRDQPCEPDCEREIRHDRTEKCPRRADRGGREKHELEVHDADVGLAHPVKAPGDERAQPERILQVGLRMEVRPGEQSRVECTRQAVPPAQITFAFITQFNIASMW